MMEPRTGRLIVRMEPDNNLGAEVVFGRIRTQGGNVFGTTPAHHCLHRSHLVERADNTESMVKQQGTKVVGPVGAYKGTSC